MASAAIRRSSARCCPFSSASSLAPRRGQGGSPDDAHGDKCHKSARGRQLEASLTTPGTGNLAATPSQLRADAAMCGPGWAKLNGVTDEAAGPPALQARAAHAGRRRRRCGHCRPRRPGHGHRLPGRRHHPARPRLRPATDVRLADWPGVQRCGRCGGPCFPGSTVPGGRDDGAVAGFGAHFCTASVVDSPAEQPDRTAAHCVYDRVGTLNVVVFVPGYHKGQAPYGTWRVIRVSRT